MPDIVLVGGGGHGVSAVEIIRAGGRFTIRGYIDPASGGLMERLGVDWLGGDDCLDTVIASGASLALTIGQIKSASARQAVGEKLLRAGADLPVITALTATLSAFSSAGDGTLIFHHALINASTTIGRFNIINSGAIVEHDSSTGDFVHIAPGAIVLGHATIGNRTFIGAGAIIREGVTIGDDCIIGAGEVIKSDLKDGQITNSNS